MPERTLTLREINRATLARQLLLERSALPVAAAVERLVGLQAQLSRPPFVGLWTRLADLPRAEIAEQIANQTLIKATMMRATLHFVSAADYGWLRATIEPALAAARDSIVKRRGGAFEIDDALAAARPFLAEQPRSFTEITALFEELMPDVDVGSLRYTVRTTLPLVQVPDKSAWSYPGNPKFALAESWLGRSVDAAPDFRELVRRYLAAFGPATVNDLQTWSGLGKLKGDVDKLKPELRIYRDEQGHELLDLPDGELPPENAPAPVRFLPEFDNLLLSHKDRRRVVADEYRKQVYLPGLRVAATILVDGFVRGAWTTEQKKGIATLTITPFAPLTAADRKALSEEGERLIRFVEPDAKGYEVKFGA